MTINENTIFSYCFKKRRTFDVGYMINGILGSLVAITGIFFSIIKMYLENAAFLTQPNSLIGMWHRVLS